MICLFTPSRTFNVCPNCEEQIGIVEGVALYFGLKKTRDSCKIKEQNLG